MFKFLLISLLGITMVSAQTTVIDSLTAQDSVHNIKFNYKQLILPAALLSYGFIGLESHPIQNINTKIRDEVKEDIDQKITIDDFSQYAPAASVYALNAMGIKGKNRFKDRTIIMATSYAIMASSVFALKSITKIERPDGTTNNSFPSGHTANAFAGAEFLWQEYKDTSVWYGIAGYAVAAGTGAFRIVNNRHWLTDVAAGAGIGILSTKIAYWLYPFINDTLFGNSSKDVSKERKTSFSFAPTYNGSQVGGVLIIQF
ncbi:phosphatase PAP2 family protein [Flavobacterium cerinum]|uniref:Phosphatase PAP2 family protein n=1 Tax=Flavobacterium cerinum TaxID=2502784 RepID=A0A444GMT4_9FLAO|nr:phosphatase PAP2 family protein [Flavobacterium cerinum]RWW92356.1 phosphatase PAP2 family protein [Flavobacterium cerinum]